MYKLIMVYFILESNYSNLFNGYSAFAVDILTCGKLTRTCLMAALVSQELRLGFPITNWRDISS
jgi:hypothetical protein